MGCRESKTKKRKSSSQNNFQENILQYQNKNMFKNQLFSLPESINCKNEKNIKKEEATHKNESKSSNFEINKEENKEEIINEEPIKKIILDENLPNPTKWIINGNEPLYYLRQFDNLGLNEAIRKIFFIGEKFQKDDNYHIFYSSKDKNNNYNNKIIDKINRIKYEVYDKYVGFKSIKEEVDNSFKEITEKYIEKISNENNKINIDKLFDEYLIKSRIIFMDDYERSNENINKNISSQKFFIYYSSFPSDKNIKYFNDHPVLFGFYKAWVNHCPITITPNMIWQLILNVFIKYVDINSEQLRNKFVNFEGKKVLEVFQIIEDEINLIPNKEEWEQIIDKLIIKIGENTGDCILDEFILDFTTNDKNLLFVQKVSVMAMFKKYFEYKAILGITCGYPYINLEGTIKDWILIKKKLNDFKKYGLKDWINSINYIIDEIINTKKGKINYNFWKDILFEHFGRYNEVYEGEIKYIIFTGWLSKFFYLNNKGNEIFGDIKMKYSKNDSSDNPLSEFSITPLKVVFPGNKEKELKILSGIIGISQDPNTLCVRPELGFFIVDEKWGKDKN